MNPLFTFFYWNQFHTKQNLRDNVQSGQLLAEKIDLIETEMGRRIRDVIWA